MTLALPRSLRSPTLRAAMVVVAVVAVALAVVADQRWRWGDPKPLPFVREDALERLRAVIQSDCRMYDGRDVLSLSGFIEGQRLLIGKTKEQVVALLGPPFRIGGESPPTRSADGEICYLMGTSPRDMLAHPPTLSCHFAPDGKCDRVGAMAGD